MADRDDSEEIENDGPNALDLLKQDHRKVQELFEAFENADNRSKPRIVQQALTELDVHAQLEEGLIYPAIREEIDADELMDQALEEHHLAKLLIKELKSMNVKDDRYSAKFKVLAEVVKHHIEEEESQILPQAEELQLDFSELGQKALDRKHKLMQKGGGAPRGTAKQRTSRRGARGRPRKRRAA